MKEKRVDTRVATVILDDDGFVRVVIKPKSDIDLEDIIEVFRGVRKFYQGEKIPIFIDGRDTKSITREARSFSSNDERPIEVGKAVAYLIGNPVSRVIANFFLGLNKPPFPFKIFNSEEIAIRWLKEFL